MNKVETDSDLGATVRLRGCPLLGTAMRVSSSSRYHEEDTVIVGVLLGVLNVEMCQFW